MRRAKLGANDLTARTDSKFKDGQDERTEDECIEKQGLARRAKHSPCVEEQFARMSGGVPYVPAVGVVAARVLEQGLARFLKLARFGIHPRL